MKSKSLVSATSVGGLTWCYAPAKLFLITLAIFFSSIALAGKSWIKGAWISDAELTMQTNPSYRAINKQSDEYQMVFNLFGKIAWIFDSNHLEVVREQGGHTSSYEVEPVKPDRIKLTIDATELWRIDRSTSGFCATLLESGGESREDLDVVECFKPVGT